VTLPSAATPSSRTITSCALSFLAASGYFGAALEMTFGLVIPCHFRSSASSSCESGRNRTKKYGARSPSRPPMMPQSDRRTATFVVTGSFPFSAHARLPDLGSGLLSDLVLCLDQDLILDRMETA
jgi:hypothetical protein